MLKEGALASMLTKMSFLSISSHYHNTHTQSLLLTQCCDRVTYTMLLFCQSWRDLQHFTITRSIRVSSWMFLYPFGKDRNCCSPTLGRNLQLSCGHSQKHCTCNRKTTVVCQHKPAFSSLCIYCLFCLWVLPFYLQGCQRIHCNHNTCQFLICY